VLPAPHLDPATGYAGQEITVRGQALAGGPGVRVAWFYEGATRTAGVVNVNPLSRYQAIVTVPYDAAPGPAQVCVAVTGSEAAEFACADFAVTDAPPGEVVFVPPADLLPPPGGDPTYLLLLDRSGAAVVELPLVSTDTVRIPDVPVGLYQLAVVGSVAQNVELEPVLVQPAEMVTATIRPQDGPPRDPLTGEPCDNSLRVTQVSLTPSTKKATVPELAQAGLAEFPEVDAAAPEFDFGVYVAGVALKGKLAAQTQASGTIIEWDPRYVLVSPTDPTKKLEGVIRGWNHKFEGDVELGASIFTAGLWTLYIYPRNAAGKEYCPASRMVRFVDDPMKSPYFRQQGGQSVTTWNSQTQQYEFKGVMPNFLGLPLRFPDPPPDLPVLGPLRNELEAGLFVQGSMGLDHTMTFTALDAKAYAMALNKNLYEKQFSIKPSWMKNIHYDPDNPDSLRVQTDQLSLVTLDWKTTVYRGTLVSFWGIVTVNASVSLGLHGEVLFQATIYPLKPAADIVVTPYLEPWLAVSIWVDLLFGLASAGADATASVFVGLPIHINTQDSRVVYLGDPCMGARILLSVWARVNLWFWKKTWNLGEWKLLDYVSDGCSEQRRRELEQKKPPAPPPPPRLLGTPVMAGNDDGGGMVAAFVGDATPGSITPTPKIYVMYKARDEKEWDINKAIALTDGSRMVQDPAAIFANGRIIVAWTETMMSQDEDQAAGNDMGKIVQRQEIWYSYAEARPYPQWSAPARVTDDLVADGRPVLAGSELDGATLAWVRGGRSDYTRSDTQIAVVEWDQYAHPDAVVWGARTVMDFPGMEAQPTAARIQFSGRAYGKRALAFVTNADGDTSGRERRVRLYYSDVDAANAVWRELDTSGLPANAMSPSVSIDSQNVIWLAFLVGSPNAPGSPVDPAARLHLARFDNGRLTAVRQVLDWKDNCEVGEPVFAEKPTMMLDARWRAVVAFRRFGAAGTNGALGQIAMLKTDVYGSGCRWQLPPQYLTNENRPNWLPTAAINHRSNEISLLWLQRSDRGASAGYQAAVARLGPASPAALPAARVQTIVADGDPLRALTLEPVPDPTLDPALLFEPTHAISGTPVVITATVRSLGIADTSGVTVELYQGIPGSGTLVLTQTVTETLAFGMPQPVTLTVTAGDAPEPYYAEVKPGADGDSGIVNNQATGTLNALGRPLILGIVESPRFKNAAELSWGDDGNPAVVGYRVVRATAPDGPYELVGLSQGQSYADLGLERMTTYYYKIQSYDRLGHVSEYSLPVAAALPVYRLYMPAVSR
jgi:hypothetical protein